MTDSYAVDAPFYDAIHASFREDVGLWLSFAGRTDRPVLEVGCGSGRVSIELAKAGHTVSGIDPSAAMLAIARQKADDDAIDVELVNGGLLDLALGANRYGFVLVPQDVFLYCSDGEEQLDWLKAIAELLHFSGTLAIDLPGPALGLDPATNGQPLLVFAAVDDEDGAFDVWHIHEDDLAAQTRWLRVTYEQLGEDGVVRRKVSEHQLRYVYRFEIEYLLSIAGLALVDVYGDYDLGAFTSDSERMIVIARRAQG